jgi:hypothetical protein
VEGLSQRILRYLMSDRGIQSLVRNALNLFNAFLFLGIDFFICFCHKRCAAAMTEPQAASGRGAAAEPQPVPQPVGPGIDLRTHADVAYDKLCWLASHNAFAYVQRYLYPQQSQGLRSQLEHGARCLLLDIHMSSITRDVRLMHESEWADRWMRWSGLLWRGRARRFVSGLIRLREWMQEHPHAIITVSLESYVEDGAAIDRAFDDAGLGAMVLRPGWDPRAGVPAGEPDRWPTLHWMIANNRRLVVFTDVPRPSHPVQSAYSYYGPSFIISSEYGTLKLERAIQEEAVSRREDTHTRTLYIQNWFAFPEVAAYSNSKRVLHRLLARCPRRPNFLALNHVNWGSGAAVVAELNGLGSTDATRTSEHAHPCDANADGIDPMHSGVGVTVTG